MRRESLDDIACRHGTDKSTLTVLDRPAEYRHSRPPRGHGYSIFYEHYFEPLRDSPIRLLEIGVLDGRSLATWADYFPKAQLYGLDIDPACARFAGPRTKIFTGSQTDRQLLARVRDEVPEGFDIIIDDGSHYVDHVITSFDELFPHLRPGGLYVIEDLHVAQDASWGRIAWNRGMDLLREPSGNDPRRMVEFLKRTRSAPQVRELTLHLGRIGFIEKATPGEVAAPRPDRGDPLDDLAPAARWTRIPGRVRGWVRQAIAPR